ncbi:hypothetical protein VKT23_013711 [Stygiomarasmius scandens]|uniref:Uncharacterized protein n=1 Tax=Marasmiellus scandens TaxID=2682957 RepID=A0ABR1J5Z8_9AGAR
MPRDGSSLSDHQSMPLFNSKDPEFLVEVLHHYIRDVDHHSKLDFDAFPRCTPPIPFEFDDKPLKRMRILLDTLAIMMTSVPGNHAAVAASITRESTAPVTLTIYFAFNFVSDENIARSTEHLLSIYSLIRTIPPPIGSSDSPSDFSELTFSILEDIVELVHTFSRKQEGTSSLRRSPSCRAKY